MTEQSDPTAKGPSWCVSAIMGRLPSKTETAARRLVAELYRARLNGSSRRNRLVARLGDATAKDTYFKTA
jgi:hypothetical protein